MEAEMENIEDVSVSTLVKGLEFASDPEPEQASEPVIEEIQLDPDGDLVLAMGNVRLLVSSKVLQLSCPFFKIMLQTNRFAEGVEQPNSAHPPIKELHEDHPDILQLMCQVLHYQAVRPVKSIEDLDKFAIVCCFYGCTSALSFHVQAWMDDWNLSTLVSHQVQTLLWVSFAFRLSTVFERLCGRLAQTLTPSEWKAWEVHPMPGHLKEDMRMLCDDLKWKMQEQIETIFSEVCDNDEEHTRDYGDKKCANCGLNKPRLTKTCGNCRSIEFDDYVCTNGTRAQFFKEWLGRQGLWPLSRLREKSCMSLSMHRVKTARSFYSDNPCGHDPLCPLPRSVEKLGKLLGETFDESPGLSLDNYDNESKVHQ